MMRVESKVSVYEIDGAMTEEAGMSGPLVTVKSHWNRDDFVVIEVPGAKPVTVLRHDLARAIQNAGNWR